MKGFTAKRDERRTHVLLCSAETSAGRKPVRGFTLIEAMIAVTILTLSIAGPLYTANSAIVASMTARDQLTASYLAQEGIEYVRAMRDYEFLSAYQAAKIIPNSDVSGTAWNNFLTGDIGHLGAVTQCRMKTCTIDITRDMGFGSGSSIVQCIAGGTCAKLYLLADGRYATEHSLLSGLATAFSRTIQVVDISGTESNPLYPDKSIVSTVSWWYHSTQHFVKVYDHLTPWQ